MCLSVPLVNVLKFDFGVLSCRAKVAFMSCRFNVADAYVEFFFGVLSCRSNVALMSSQCRCDVALMSL